MAEVADQIVATDVSLKRLERARYFGRDALNLQGVAGDAHGLYLAEGTFNAGLAISWFTHVPRRRPGEFLADRMYNLTTARKGEVDDYEMRRLEGGETFEIVDNKFRPSRSRACLCAYGRESADPNRGRLLVGPLRHSLRLL